MTIGQDFRAYFKSGMKSVLFVILFFGPIWGITAYLYLNAATNDMSSRIQSKAYFVTYYFPYFPLLIFLLGFIDFRKQQRTREDGSSAPDAGPKD